MAGQLYNEKETTNVATDVRISGNDALGKVGDTFETQAQADFQEARSRYSKAINTSTSFAMKEALQNYSSDPNKLSEELQKIRTKTVGTIEDDELKVDFLANFDLQSQSYLSKATYDYNQKIKKENKDLANLSINDDNEMMGLTIENMLTPSSSPDDWVNYSRSKESIEKQLNAKQLDGTDVFTESEKKKYRSEIGKTTRKSVIGYFNSLNDVDKLDYANKILSNNVKVAQNSKLSDIMDKENIDYLQGFARRFKDGYEEKIKKGMDKEKAANLTAIEDMTHDEVVSRYKELSENNFANSSVNNLMDFYNDMQEKYTNGEMDDKTLLEYNVKLAYPMRKKIDEDREKRKKLLHWNTNLQVGFDTIDDMVKNDPEVFNNSLKMMQMYIELNNTLNRMGINTNEKSMSGRETVRKIAENVYRDFIIQDANVGGASNQEVAKIYTGKTLIDFRKQNPELTTDKETPYKVEKNEDGSVYLVYKDANGQYSDKSRRRLFKKADEKENSINIKETIKAINETSPLLKSLNSIVSNVMPESTKKNIDKMLEFNIGLLKEEEKKKKKQNLK